MQGVRVLRRNKTNPDFDLVPGRKFAGIAHHVEYANIDDCLAEGGTITADYSNGLHPRRRPPTRF
jgi:hypothetical protein